MNWDAIGALAELIAAIAVLASLIYLANQIRQGTEVARSVARQGIAEAAMAEASSVIEHGDLAQILFRDVSGEELEDHEDYRVQLFTFRSLRFYENVHYQYRSGMLEDDEWEAFRYNLQLLFQLGMYERFWQGHEKQFTPVFRSLVEQMRQELSESNLLGSDPKELVSRGIAPGL